MGSNYQVTVLGPNGRRTNIKANPGTSILQVIEEACTKQNLKANFYNVKHLRRILDSSSTIRYSNVPNKAQLELVEAAVPRIESGSVTVNLVAETGQRLIADFSSNSTLYEILEHHSKEGNLSIPDQESDLEAVIVYTMRRINGNDLKTTTLKSLGLLNGKCMLRYNRQTISPDGPSQANVSGPLIHPKKILQEIPPKPKSTVPSQHSFEQNKSTIFNQSLDTCNDKELNEELSIKEDVSASTKEITSEVVNPLEKNSTSVVEQMEVDEPTNEDEVPVSQPGPSTESAAEYKQPVTVQLGSHDSILFCWDDAPTTNISEEPDEFYDLTVNEAKKLYQEKIKAIKDFEDAPLITKEMREGSSHVRLLTAMNKHPVTQLRICFQDRNVIQASFKPRNTIQQVKDFIRPFLVNPQMEFSLYTVMPKKILDPTCSLVDADCIPKARLYFEAKDSSKSSFLSEETLAKKSSFEGASSKIVVNKPTSSLTLGDGPSTSGQASCSSSSSAPPRPEFRQSSKFPENSSSKKPKWFKLGK